MLLFSALHDLAFVLQDFVRSTATGGSTSTLVDTDRFEGSDFFDKGTLFILGGSLSNKAPIISNWDNTTKTFTFATQSASVVAGDVYSAIPRDFPKGVMIKAVNQALDRIGILPKTDINLVTVADQEEYTLPNGVCGVKGVEIATTDSSPYYYVPHYNWIEREGKLVFDTDYQPMVDDYKIRLSYNAAHPDVSDDDDVIDDLIDRELLRWTAAVHALRWRMIRNPEEVGARMNEALANENKFLHRKPKVFHRDPHFSRWY
jgi:hypothetical protein